MILVTACRLHIAICPQWGIITKLMAKEASQKQRVYVCT